MKWVGLLTASASLCAPACIMAGYDRAPLHHDVSPPESGSGASGAGGSSGNGAPGGGRSATGSAGTSAGTSGGAGSAGANAAPVVDVCGRVPAGSACNDGRKCTLNDYCSGGYCVGTPMVCPLSLIDCSPIVCAESSGTCVNQALPDGSACGISGVLRCVAGLCTSPQTCTTKVCNADCQDSLSCLYQCRDSDECSAQCAAGAGCFFDCENGGRCTHGCASNSSCRIDCTGADSCAVSCQANARCIVDCRGTGDCSAIECAPGAICGLTCSPGATCKFKRCDSGPMSCGPNMIGCGGCP
jgi:hypothetical protein